MPDPLALALAVVLSRLPPPYAPPDRAEAAAEERRAFVPKAATALATAAREATCSGPWAELECRRRWPGPPEEIAALAASLGYWESRLDARIQAGDCEVWGASPNRIECDGLLFRSGVRPPHMPGLSKRTKFGLVVFRSSTMFQIQGLSDDELRETVGLGEMNLFEASRHAIRVLSGARSMCRHRAWYGVEARGWSVCVVSAFAGTITFRQAPARVATFEKILREVRAELRATTSSAVGT